MKPVVRESLVIAKQPPLDGELYKEFVRLSEGTVESYVRLRPDAGYLVRAKGEFFDSGYTSDPDLRPTALDTVQLAEENRSFDAFGKEVDEAEVAKDVRLAYHDKIQETMAGTQRVIAAAEGDAATFDHLGRTIYGTPDAKVFAASADWFRHVAHEVSDSTHNSVREAAERVLKTVPDLGGDRADLIPDAKTFEKVWEDQWRELGYFTLLLSGIQLPDHEPVTPASGDPIVKAALRNIGAGHYALVDAPGKTWMISHLREQVERPAGYSATLKHFVGLVLGHELTHVLESINGKRSALRLAGLGLARYERGNEGRALVREQVVHETFEQFSRLPRWQEIMRRHFAISLGSGTEGKRPYRFSEVFEAVNAIDCLQERLKTPDAAQEADKRARERTWALLTRVLKGTDGKGGADLKDIIYLEGNLKSWHTERIQPGSIDAGDFGKFDIANDEDVALLQKLGVLPRPEPEQGSVA